MLGERDHVLLMTMHHIVSDGWSMGVLLNELSALYGAFLEGGSDRCRRWRSSMPTTPLGSGSGWRASVLERQLQYWRADAGGRAGVPGAADRPAAAAGARPRGAGIVEVRLDPELSRALKALAPRRARRST